MMIYIGLYVIYTYRDILFNIQHNSVQLHKIGNCTYQREKDYMYQRVDK